MSFMSTRQGQTLWMLPLSQTRGTEEGFMGEGGRVVPPLGTAEALHTGPWSGLAADRTQTWQRLPRAQATAPEPPAGPPSGRGKDGGQPRHRIQAPTPPPEGPVPCSLQLHRPPVSAKTSPTRQGLPALFSSELFGPKARKESGQLVRPPQGWPSSPRRVCGVLSPGQPTPSPSCVTPTVPGCSGEAQS